MMTRNGVFKQHQPCYTMITYYPTRLDRDFASCPTPVVDTRTSLDDTTFESSWGMQAQGTSELSPGNIHTLLQGRLCRCMRVMLIMYKSM